MPGHFICIRVFFDVWQIAVVAPHDLIAHIVGFAVAILSGPILQFLKLVEVLLLLGDLLGEDKKAIVEEKLHLLGLVLGQVRIRGLVLLLLQDKVLVLVCLMSFIWI